MIPDPIIGSAGSSWLPGIILSVADSGRDPAATRTMERMIFGFELHFRNDVFFYTFLMSRKQARKNVKLTLSCSSWISVIQEPLS